MIKNSIPQSIFEIYHERFSETPLLITNLEGIITYCNKALMRKLKLKETPIQRDLKSLLDIDLSLKEPLLEDKENNITVNLISTSFISDSEKIHIRGYLFYDLTQYVIFFNTFKHEYEQILEQVNQLNFQLSSITRDSVKQFKLKSRQAQENLEMAQHDQLTSLANRRLFMNILLKTISVISEKDSELNAGIILFDIDDFKSVNDNFGHDAGDLVLITLARTVESTIRKQDTFARYGGEEFIIVVYCDTIEELGSMAEKIRRTIEETQFPRLKKALTASFGITMIQKGDTQETLFKRADDAMYSAKKAGKNCVSKG